MPVPYCRKERWTVDTVTHANKLNQANIKPNLATARRVCEQHGIDTREDGRGGLVAVGVLVAQDGTASDEAVPMESWPALVAWLGY